MKKISAVICELNPLHKGHKYIFGEAKKDSDVLIAVMSGNFVQRGECAVYNKYVRAKAAAESGADVVVELPFPFSASSAEFFAAAGVAVAEAMGANTLYFGSECADTLALRAAAEILNNSSPSQGTSRAAADREERLRAAGGAILPESVYTAPNDILAVEYCRRAKISLHPVKRISGRSAKSIREDIFAAHMDSEAVYPEVLTGLEFSHFRTYRTSEIFAEGGGGVTGRLRNAAFATNDPSLWLGIAATKQYTNARLRRAALFAACGVPTEMMKDTPRYTALLAATAVGRAYIRENSKNFAVPLVIKSSDRAKLDSNAMAQYKMREFADKLYSLCAGEADVGVFSKKSPVIL